MKNLGRLVFVLLLFVLVVPAAFGQEESEESTFMKKGPKHHRMRQMYGGELTPADVVTPSQFVGFDESTKQAWLEIENMELRKKTDFALAIAAALAIGLAAIGGALAQGRVASSALDGIARNPDASSKIFTPLVISLALIESLVIYALVIAFLLQGKM